ncbi:NACHT, LRR and PYD domains-containing protein 12-like isoform X2 [Electrophorus electricus]|uniref:NACHT, LRR and PYD domains-containing protein 12-like isoform X2 n=1 Tax=Electrophorus electricus TaxID=8005 RepID=UPI0015D05A4A|nr:NACHT, LRR and PYD domains-containing protein 12-like isoform X2 [Electrophorus electricus]
MSLLSEDALGDSVDYEDKRHSNVPTKPEARGAEGAGPINEQARANSPVPSCVSMKSDWSMELPVAFKKENLVPEECDKLLEPDAPVPSYLSINSDHSMAIPLTLNDGVSPNAQSVWPETAALPAPSCLSTMTDQSMDPPNCFTELDCFTDQRDQTRKSGIQSDQSQEISETVRTFEERFLSFVKREMKRISQLLSPGYPGEVEASEEEEDSSEAREAALKIGLHVLQGMNEPELVGKVNMAKSIFIHQRKLKSSLKSKSQCIFEGIAKQGNPALLNKIYTELYITEGGSGMLNDEHEVRQIESEYRSLPGQETPIICNDIFKPLPGQEKNIRTVLTKGVAGIGKTVSAQKFILDWAEGQANQDVHFMFPLPFRELNLMGQQQYSLEGLLHCFFKDMQEVSLSILENTKVIFVFDGLDECRLPLDFKSNERCSDVTKATSVDVLLTNLILGNLLPSALIWITTRPAAANQLPAACVDQVTEVRGFNDPQKEEYFHKRITDRDLAGRIIQHVKSSRSLYIMCHIPVFCWISATVLERLLSEAEKHQVPKSLTEMYTHFLIFQTVRRNDKYTEGKDLNPCLTKENILSLGKLAFQQLSKGNLIFYEKDLMDCGIDVKEASVYSGLCTQIFREELAMWQRKVYCFVHLSFQEYLAALFAYMCWLSPNGDHQPDDINIRQLCLNSTVFDLHRSAVDLALHSERGHMDLFLRFLLGLSLESNQNLLHDLLTQDVNDEQSHQETVKYIKLKLGENLRPENSINLFHCLLELNDHSLVQEIQAYLSSKSLCPENLSPAQWSALVFVLMTSEEKMEVFDLRKYVKSNEGFKRLEPVAKASRTVILSSCNLTEAVCPNLALSLRSCATRELDLSFNSLNDRGVKLMCVGLRSSDCLLETLNLQFCEFRKDGCAALVSALQSNPSHLRELDLSHNLTGNQAIAGLLAILPDTRLETLRLSGCGVTREGCVFLASAIGSKPSCLKNLDLSDNKLGDLGVRVLPELLSHKNCQIEYLRLEKCNITWKSCKTLLHASSQESWSLRTLDLSDNDLQDSGVKQLAYELSTPCCKIQKLRLASCRFTMRGFSALASALRSNPTSLHELDLSSNFPDVSAMRQLLSALRKPNCALRTLRVDKCCLSSEVCGSMSTTLSQNATLRELSLNDNPLGDDGLKTLFAGLQSGLCNLKTLRRQL